MQSSGSQSASTTTHRIPSLMAATDTRGKHRIQAELKRLEQEARFLENQMKKTRSDSVEELEQLERMERASAACSELLGNVETSPDPLLPATHGPVNPLWDRWFEGPQDKKGCRCWIL